MELLCLGANIAARSLDVVTTQHSLQAGAVEGVLHAAEMWIDPEHIRPDGVEAGPLLEAARSIAIEIASPRPKAWAFEKSKMNRKAAQKPAT